MANIKKVPYNSQILKLAPINTIGCFAPKMLPKIVFSKTYHSIFSSCLCMYVYQRARERKRQRTRDKKRLIKSKTDGHVPYYPYKH